MSALVALFSFWNLRGFCNEGFFGLTRVLSGGVEVRDYRSGCSGARGGIIGEVYFAGRNEFI